MRLPLQHLLVVPGARSRDEVEEVHITLDDLADRSAREPLELELDDGVVYTFEAGLPLDRVSVLVGRVAVPLETLIEDAGLTERETLVIGLRAPTDTLLGTHPQLAIAGCWWQWVDGAWVRYCIA